MSDSVRFHKILALAVNPAAKDGEAQAAFAKLRDLVKQNPAVTAPPPPPPMPEPVAVKEEETSTEWRLTNLPPFWLPITASNLSEQAFALGLRSKIVYDFKVVPTAIDILCVGSPKACESFNVYLKFLIDYTNTQPANPPA